MLFLCLIVLIAMIVVHMVSTAHDLNINAPLIGTTIMYYVVYNSMQVMSHKTSADVF